MKLLTHLNSKEKPRKHLEAWRCLRHLYENMPSGLWKQAFTGPQHLLSALSQAISPCFERKTKPLPTPPSFCRRAKSRGENKLLEIPCCSVSWLAQERFKYSNNERWKKIKRFALLFIIFHLSTNGHWLSVCCQRSWCKHKGEGRSSSDHRKEIIL